MSRVTSIESMPNPSTSTDDEPRPVPNSNRPGASWSSIATFSATRAGWQIGGVMLMIPEPMWMRSVIANAYAIQASLADRCEYSSRKWCSVTHTYLKPERSAACTTSSSARRTSCSVSPASRRWFGWYMPTKMPNSTIAPPSRGGFEGGPLRMLARDRHDLTGHVARVVGCQEHDHVGHLPRLRVATERLALRELGEQLVGGDLGQVGVHGEARRDRVDAHTSATGFDRGTAGERHHTCLRRGVVRLLGLR